jgi:hypothetical protein
LRCALMNGNRVEEEIDGHSRVRAAGVAALDGAAERALPIDDQAGVKSTHRARVQPRHPR